MLAILPLAIGMTLPWRSAVSPAPAGDWKGGLRTALDSLAWEGADGPELVVLSVAQEHLPALNDICSEAARALSADLLVGVVGAGVLGDGAELDREPGISLLAGRLPPETTVKPFVVSGATMPVWGTLVQAEAEAGGLPGFLLFADPMSAVKQVADILASLSPSSCVAGGLSCPTSTAVSSLALYQRGSRCRALPPGSLAGLALCGPNFELHTATAQGAAPIGPTFVVTKGEGSLVEELDGEPAVRRLQAIVEQAQGSRDERLLKLISTSLLVGFPPKSLGRATDGGGEGDAAGDGEEDERDFLIRQVIGQEAKGGLFVGEEVVPGTTRLRFHVRDAQAAHDDLSVLLGRYRLERSFSGRFGTERSSTPLAGLLFSCNGRGRNMYEGADHDSSAIRTALGEQLPLGGYFGAGELGPVGLGGLGGGGAEIKPHLHGFTSVLALMYDTSAGTSDGGEAGGDARGG